MLSGIGELIATASASFFVGWAFKSYGLGQIVRNIKNVKNLPLEDLKMVFVVRSDLPMTKGKIAAQCSHAALSCYKRGLVACPQLVNQWELKGQTKVVLRSYSGEEGLKQIEKNAKNAGLITALVRDAGRTQVPSGTATVLAIGPDLVSKVDRVTSHLKLL